jgi:hypothetical protein
MRVSTVTVTESASAKASAIIMSGPFAQEAVQRRAAAVRNRRTLGIANMVPSDAGTA